MRGIVKGLIIFFIILIAGLTTFLVIGITRGTSVFSFFTDRFEVKFVRSRSIPIEDITQITINGYNDDLTIKTGAGDDIVIKEYAGSQAAQGSFLAVKKDNTTLEIESDQRNGHMIFVMGSNARSFEIYLPESFQADWKIASDSGDIEIDCDLQGENFEASTDSGSVAVETVTADTITIEASSGDVEGNILEGSTKVVTDSGSIRWSKILGDAVLKADSGEVELNGAVGQFQIQTDSGEIQIDEIEGGAKVSSSSGDVELFFDKLTAEVVVETSSGEITCGVPQNESFQFEAKTGSGEIDCFFDDEIDMDEDEHSAKGAVGEGATIPFTAESHSGDIEIVDL